MQGKIGGWIWLLTCTTYKVIHHKYDNLLEGYDNLSVILESPPRRVYIYVCASFLHKEFYYIVTPFLGRSHMQYEMLIWSHKSKLALSWTLKYVVYSIMRMIVKYIYLSILYWQLNLGFNFQLMERWCITLYLACNFLFLFSLITWKC